VVEACGGLSMLLTFAALAVACAIAIKRPILDRIAVVFSAVPIALLANVVRIVITGVLYEKVSGQAAQLFFHDVAGWFMMLFALGILWLELSVLSRLFRDRQESTVAMAGALRVQGSFPSRA
jgi:exosortase/archaeosortase family protein